MSGIKKIRFDNVRSHQQVSFDFVPGMNAIVGPNGSGKTTIIEGLYTMLRGSSFRGSLIEIMRYGQGQYQMSLESGTKDSQETRKLTYLIQDETTTKKWQVEGKSYARLPGGVKLPVVLFEPDIARLVTGSPQRRREYLDQLAGQLDIEFASNLASYDRALKQRNKLLKSTSLSTDSLFVWNAQLARLGEIIVANRLSLIELLQKDISKYYRQLGGDDEILLTYQSSVYDQASQYGSKLLHFLEASVQRDMILGYTSFGPHRDDMQIMLADQPANERASRGEVRTAVIALKMLETEILARHYGHRKIKPTLLMDDVLSELDLVHQERVLAGFKDYQVFITTTDAHTLTPGVHTIAL